MLSDVSVLIHGAARGADSIAAEYARNPEHFCKELPFPADWHMHGKAAGPIRNQQMIDEGQPDFAMGYSTDPNSRGTKDMMLRLWRAGVPFRMRFAYAN